MNENSQGNLACNSSIYPNTWSTPSTRTVKETVEEYDGDGKLVKRTITETTTTDSYRYQPYQAIY